jgi:hypothetical protein
MHTNYGNAEVMLVAIQTNLSKKKGLPDTLKVIDILKMIIKSD